MADLRLLVAAALNSSDLSHSDLHETAIDRVGALAFTEALGGALWALKWAGEPRGYWRAMDLLMHRCQRLTADAPRRSKLCRIALIEWFDDRCHVCGGRRVLVATENAPVRVCTVCNGTGQRRYSELWRAQQLELEPAVARKWSARIDSVHQKIIDAEGQAWRDLAAQLGRREVRDLHRRKPLDLAVRKAILAATGPPVSARNGRDPGTGSGKSLTR